MLGSDVVEVGIGLILLFLFMSVICAAVREAIEGVLKSRAKDLEQGIRELLNDKNGTGLATQLFDHPLLSSLFLGSYSPSDFSGNRRRFRRMGLVAGRKLPSYIPSSQFAEALLDVVFRGPVAATNSTDAQSNVSTDSIMSIDGLRTAVAKIDNINVQRAVLSAIDMAQGDLNKVKANIEDWFNGTMDRVSGWYKRRTQTILFFIGLATAVALNVDAITIAKRLNEDKALRQAAVAQAGTIVSGQGAAAVVDGRGAPAGQGATGGQGATSGQGVAAAQGGGATIQDPLTVLQKSTYDQLQKNLLQIGYPIGWSPIPQTRCTADAGQSALKDCHTTLGKLEVGQWIEMLLGWLITALAIMLGAPFWFDILNKVMVIRSTVKPREKSQEEASEDRQSRPIVMPVARNE